MLDKLAEAHKQYNVARRLYNEAFEKWALWNYWAHTQDWYTEFLYENGLRIMDVKAKKSTPTDLVFVREDGAPYFQNKHLTWWELDNARTARSELLRQVWYLTDENDYFVYQLGDIDQPGTIAYTLNLKKHAAFALLKYHVSWFKPREQISGWTSKHPSRGDI